eukprot:5747812-Pyramimonas_sp.AAC.1
MWMVFPLIEKPAGGHRAILLLASFVRVWERLRRPMLDPFFATTERAYWAFGSGKSAESCVWAQTALGEIAAADDQVVLGVQWDGKKYYESFRLELLRDRARQWGIPG